MVDIRINALPANASPSPTLNVPVDGATTQRTTIAQLVDAGRPLASQAEAEAGVNATKSMSPLTTKQSIYSEVGVSIASAANGLLASTALQPAAIGSTVQAFDTDLTAIAGLTSAADKAPYSTGSGTWALADFTEAGRSVVGAADAALTVSTRSAMEALPTVVKSVSLREAGREGQFVLVDYSTFSTLVDADTAQALFVRSTSDTSKAWKRVFTGPMLDTWAGVVRYPSASSQPSAVDSAPAFNAGLSIALLSGVEFGLTAGDAYVSHTVAGDVSTDGYAILNQGVSMIGLVSRMGDSCIRPLTTISQYASFISIRPIASSDITGLSFKNFMVLTYNTGFSGTKYGKKVFDQIVEDTCNISDFVMEDLYFGPGNDYSVYLYNDEATNSQGVPANATMNRCLFFEGSNLLYVGDSIRYRDCVLRSSSGSLREGVKLYQVDTVGGGVAGCFVMDNVNSDCDGGTLLMLRGRNPVVKDCNIEQSHGPGTVNGAVVDFDGSSGRIPRPIIENSAIGMFGTATVDYAIRFNGVTGGGEYHNTIVSDFKPGPLPRAAAVIVTASADNVTVGSGNVDSTSFTTLISDSGGGTRGVKRLLTLINGFTNLGFGYASATAFKDDMGVVRLTGLIKAPVTPSGLVICTLPDGFRPIDNLKCPAYALISSDNGSAWLNITTDGNIQLQTSSGGASVEQVDLSAISFTTNSKVQSTY